MTDTTIVASGDTAASPRTENIVDVPAYVPEAVTPEANVATTDTSPEQSPEEAEAKEAKKRNGYKEKLDRERAKVAELQAKLDAAAPKEQPNTQSDDKEPKPEDFETWDAYYKADAKYQARQEYTRLKAEEDTKSKEVRDRLEIDEKVTKFRERVEELKAENSDFEDVINSYKAPLPEAMRMALLDSDLGPEITYYLAKNPEEADAMAEMSVTALNRAFGKLEAKLESPTVDTMPKVKELKVTKAPPPISPVGKSSTNSAYNPYTSKGGDDYEDFIKWEKAQR